MSKYGRQVIDFLTYNSLVLQFAALKYYQGAVVNFS